MTDQAVMAGKTGSKITLGGKEYTLRPYVVGVWAEMKAFVASLKGDPIKEVCDRLDSIPPNQQGRWMKAAVEAAANQTPTDEEMLAFEKSLLGQAFHLWACLKADHLAEFPTPHVVYELMVAEAEEHGQSKLTEIMLKVHVGSGGEALGNSAGRSPTAPADGQPTATPSTAAGRPSTSSSPTPTNGP